MNKPTANQPDAQYSSVSLFFFAFFFLVLLWTRHFLSFSPGNKLILPPAAMVAYIKTNTRKQLIPDSQPRNCSLSHTPKDQHRFKAPSLRDTEAQYLGCTTSHMFTEFYGCTIGSNPMWQS